MQAQEAEISALRRQLESMQVAASRAHAGGGGRRQYDGSVPAEYICPITQARLLHKHMHQQQCRPKDFLHCKGICPILCGIAVNPPS